MSGVASSSAFEEGLPSEVAHAEVTVAARQENSGVTRVARPSSEPAGLTTLEDVGKAVPEGGLYNQHLLLTYAQCP